MQTMKSPPEKGSAFYGNCKRIGSRDCMSCMSSNCRCFFGEGTALALRGGSALRVVGKEAAALVTCARAARTARLWFGVLRHERRKLVTVAVTSNPTPRVAGREVTQPSPGMKPLRYLVRERDGAFGHRYHRRCQNDKSTKWCQAPSPRQSRSSVRIRVQRRGEVSLCGYNQSVG
jgi:hypothetical protein